MRFLTLLLFIAAFTSCVAMGTKVDEAKLTQFERGKSHYEEVIQILGQPTSMTLNSDGSRIITYSYTQTQARPINYVPMVGPFLQGGDTEQSMTTLEFTPDGLMRTYTTTSGHMPVGTGFSSGARQK